MTIPPASRSEAETEPDPPFEIDLVDDDRSSAEPSDLNPESDRTVQAEPPPLPSSSPPRAFGLEEIETQQLGKIRYVIDELPSWRHRGWIDANGERAIRAEYETRRDRLITRGRVRQCIERARTSMVLRHFDEVDRLASKVRELDPDHDGAWSLGVESLRERRRLEEAHALACEGVERGQEQLRVVRDAIAEQLQREAPTVTTPPPVPQPKPVTVRPLVDSTTQVRESVEASTPVAIAEPVAIGPSWVESAFAVLQRHWQRMILLLGGILLLVSSTAIAALLLGDELLGSTTGRCFTLLVYSMAFASLGGGLLRWGADQAGRIILLMALLLIPMNFTLTSVMLSGPEPFGIRVALVGLAWIGLAGLGAVTSRRLTSPASVPIAFALLTQGSLMLASPWLATGSLVDGVLTLLGSSALLLASTSWLTRRLSKPAWSEPLDEHDGPEPPSARDWGFGLGVLAFAHLWTTVRISMLIPMMAPLWFALPTALGACAALMTTGAISKVAGGRVVIGMRIGSYVLAALALTLAVVRPLDSVPSLAALNTGLTASLVIAVYVQALQIWRHPALLYSTMAASGVLGMAVWEATQPWSGLLSTSLAELFGYGSALPPAFLGWAGLPIVTLLMVTAWWIRSQWGDARLANHLLPMALTLSVVGSAVSAIEPLAGAIGLAGYAVALGVMAWSFRRPWLVVLASGSGIGAAMLAGTLIADLTLGSRALGVAGIAVAYWFGLRLIPRSEELDPYRQSLARMIRLAGVGAFGLIVAGLIWDPVVIWTTSASLGCLAILALLLYQEFPRKSLAYAALGYLVIGATLVTGLGESLTTRIVSDVWFSTALSCFGSLVAFTTLISLGDGRETSSRRFGLIPIIEPEIRIDVGVVAGMLAIVHAAIMVVLLGSPWVPEPSNLIAILPTGLAAGTVFAMGTRYRTRYEPLAGWAVASWVFGLTAGMLASGPVLGWSSSTLLPIDVAFALSATGPLLWLAVEILRRRGLADPAQGLARHLVHGMIVVPILVVLVSSLFSLWDGFREPGGLIGPFALVGLTWIGANRHRPSAPIAGMAMAGLTSAILCVVAVQLGTVDGVAWSFGITTLMVAWAWLGLGEALRRRSSDKPVACWLYATEVVGWIGLVVGLLWPWTAQGSLGLASYGGVLALGASVALGLTRWEHPRMGAVVAAGLAWLSGQFLALWAWESYSRPSPLSSADQIAVLAGASALTAFLLLGGGRLARRLGALPLANTWRAACMYLAVIGSLQVLWSASISLDSYPILMPVMLVLTAFYLAASLWQRRSSTTYLASAQLVIAAYVTLFWIGDGQEGHVSTLGLLATGLATGFWIIGRVSNRFLPESIRPRLSRPWEHAVICLIGLSLPLNATWSLALALTAVPVLLLTISFPSIGWMAAVATILTTSALIEAYSIDPTGRIASMTLMGLAALWWLVAALVDAVRVPVCRRLGLVELAYQRPWWIACAVLIVLGLVNHIGSIVATDEIWSRAPGIPLSAAVILAAVVRWLPFRGWIDVAFGLSSFGVIALVDRWLPTISHVPLMLILLGWGWFELRPWLDRPRRILEGLGWQFPWTRSAIGDWSRGLSTLSLLSALILVALTTADSLGAIVPSVVSAIDHSGWWTLTSTLIVLTVASVRMPIFPDGVRSGVIGLILAAIVVWTLVDPAPWIGVSGWGATQPIPTVTSTLGLIAALFAIGLSGRSSETALTLPFGSGAIDGARLRQYADGLIFDAVVLSGLGLVMGPYALTLGLTWKFGTIATALAALTIAQRRRGAVVASTIAAVLTITTLAWVIPESLGIASPPATGLVISLGLLGLTIAQAGLAELLSGRERWAEVHDALERSQLWLALLVAVCVGWGLTHDVSRGTVAPESALLDTGVLIGLASVLFRGAVRHGVVWHGYLAQACVLGAYLTGRLGFPAQASWDAIALFGLALIDLGIAEGLGERGPGSSDRPGRKAMVRSSFAGALVLPVLSLSATFRSGWASDTMILTSIAVTLLYAALASRSGWRGLGYLAGLIFNGLLAMVWFRVGWSLVEQPGFYVLPIGLSTLLFAETARRELGRSGLNILRTLGLVLILTSLSIPIWRTADLLSWALVLVASLVAIGVGITIRSQVFLVLGFVTFLIDVGYQATRAGLDNAVARWAIMLGLGLSLVLFVALSEKYRLLVRLKRSLAQIRQWE